VKHSIQIMLWFSCTVTPFHLSSTLPFHGLGYSLPFLHPGVTHRVTFGYFYLGSSVPLSVPLQNEDVSTSYGVYCVCEWPYCGCIQGLGVTDYRIYA